MGTRHLVMVTLDGKTKVAQYGQWDGYPTGQGATIAQFLQSKKFSLPKFKKAVSELTWASEAEIKASWVQCGASPKSDMVSMAVSEQHAALYPEFSRDTGAKILALVYSGETKKVRDSSEFLKDSLFCEWAYELDLDNGVVNVYKGFQTTGKKDANGREEYAPCKVFKTLNFEDFKVKAMAKIEKEASENNE